MINKLRLTLFQKVLLWFLFNIVVLGIVFLGFVNTRIFIPTDSLFSGAFGERLNILPFSVGQALSTNSEKNWTSVMRAYAQKDGIGLYVVTMQGELLAASDRNLPESVILAAVKFIQKYPPPMLKRSLPLTMPNRSQQPSVQGKYPANPFVPAENTFYFETDNPTKYWGGKPIMVGTQKGPVFGLVIASSDSRSGGGYFYDPKPWLFGLGLIVLVSIIIWWPLVQSITKPLGQISGAAEKIAKGNFKVKLPTNRSDEIGRLCLVINEMSLRLEALVRGHKHFLGSVAHELTAPVARIQMGLGVLENKMPEAGDPDLEMVMEDVQAMSLLLDELLSFSRAELNQSKVSLRNVAVLPLAQKAKERESKMGCEIRLSIPESLKVFADPDLLVRALSNLLRNAARFAGMAGPIVVEAAREADRVKLTVRDFGPGVPVDDLPRLFEPFHQTANNKPHMAGVGLGLTIVKTCVEACKGEVYCRNHPEGGFEAVLLLLPSGKSLSREA